MFKNQVNPIKGDLREVETLCNKDKMSHLSSFSFAQMQYIYKYEDKSSSNKLIFIYIKYH